jgi:surface protein
MTTFSNLFFWSPKAIFARKAGPALVLDGKIFRRSDAGFACALIQATTIEAINGFKWTLEELRSISRKHPVIFSGKSKAPKSLKLAFRSVEFGPGSYLGDFDVSQVETLRGCFRFSKGHIDGLKNWDTSSVVDLNRTFQSCDFTGHEIKHWNTSSVKSMCSTFSYTPNFDADLSHWDVRAVTNMYQTFFLAKSFKGDLSNWEPHKDCEMIQTFCGNQHQFRLRTHAPWMRARWLRAL